MITELVRCCTKGARGRRIEPEFEGEPVRSIYTSTVWYVIEKHYIYVILKRKVGGWLTVVTRETFDRYFAPYTTMKSKQEKDMSIETFKEYSRYVGETAIYPGGLNSMAAVNYCTLGLIGEAGELANKLKKVHRDHGGRLSDEMRQAMLAELGDVVWYADRLALELGSDLATVAEANIDKLRDRRSRSKLKGSGDNR